MTSEIELKRDLQADKARENMQVENIYTVLVKVWRCGQYLGISISFNRTEYQRGRENKAER